MATRTCDSCGKSRELRGCKTCEKRSHSICRACTNPTGHLGLFTFSKTKCPLCESKLR